MASAFGRECKRHPAQCLASASSNSKYPAVSLVGLNIRSLALRLFGGRSVRPIEVALEGTNSINTSTSAVDHSTCLISSPHYAIENDASTNTNANANANANANNNSIGSPLAGLHSGVKWEIFLKHDGERVLSYIGSQAGKVTCDTDALLDLLQSLGEHCGFGLVTSLEQQQARQQAQVCLTSERVHIRTAQWNDESSCLMDLIELGAGRGAISARPPEKRVNARGMVDALASGRHAQDNDYGY